MIAHVGRIPILCHFERSRTLSEAEGDGAERNLLFSRPRDEPCGPGTPVRCL